MVTLHKSRLNLILSIIGAGILWLIIGLVFDYYYDLNDDVFIKDIISGLYTGIPDAHNNQMMYPISALFASIYKIAPSVPWFGLFEIGCFILSFILIGTRLLGFFTGKIKKIAFIVLQIIFWLGTYLWELTMLQYTVVCGMLCMTASVWVYTTPRFKTVKETIVADIPAIILAILAFNVRSEMFLLMCPFMAIAGVGRWMNEPTVKEAKEEGYKGIFDKANIIKYASLIGIILAGILLTTVVDKIAYSSSEWKEYRRFFDARTDVYDFTGIPDYEANNEFYSSNGISKDQYDLLISYNFDFDKSIDSEMLESIASYVKSGNAKNVDGTDYSRMTKSFKTTVGEYVRGALSFNTVSHDSYITVFADESTQLTPLNMIVIMLYVVLLIIAFFEHNWRYLIDIPAAVAFRSIAWIYIYYKGRLVPRITHPMLMIEVVILTSFVCFEMHKALSKTDRDVRFKANFSTLGFAYLVAILTFTICVISIPNASKQILRKQTLRDDINIDAEVLNEYVDKHDGYYLVDVYSTVDFTEPVFDYPQYDKSRWQLAGGWIARSPLDTYKQSNIDTRYFTSIGEDGRWKYEMMETGN